MKDTLKPGLKYTHTFKVPASKTVPALYPESEEFLVMPEVFATGFLVGLLEWACIKALRPHLDWPNEQTVGTHIERILAKLDAHSRAQAVAIAYRLQLVPLPA